MEINQLEYPEDQTYCKWLSPNACSFSEFTKAIEYV